MLNRKRIHILAWIIYFIYDYSVDILLLWQRFPYSKFDLLKQSFIFSALLIWLKIGLFYLLLAGISKIGFKTTRQRLLSVCHFIAVVTFFVVARQLIIETLTPIIYRNPPVYYTPAYRPNPPDPIFSTNRVGTAILDFLLVCGVLGITELYIRQVNALHKEKNLVRDKLQSELSFLKSQVNPHFLFNTLNNIYALARKQSPKTPEAVIRLSQLLRFTLYETQNETIPLENEIKIIEDYISLESMRYNERLSVSFKKVIPATSHAIAPLILLPFVENAFKHGISETRKNCFINITLRLEGSILCLEIENSKKATVKTVDEPSVGLKNVRRQLELMYPGNVLKVDETSAAFMVNLTIDLKNHVKI